MDSRLCADLNLERTFLYNTVVGSTTSHSKRQNGSNPSSSRAVVQVHTRTISFRRKNDVDSILGRQCALLFHPWFR